MFSNERNDQEKQMVRYSQFSKSSIVFYKTNNIFSSFKQAIIGADHSKGSNKCIKILLKL